MHVFTHAARSMVQKFLLASLIIVGGGNAAETAHSIEFTIRAGSNGLVKEGETGEPDNFLLLELSPGQNTNPIHAVAGDGASFTNWSDGNTDNPRVFTAGTSDSDIYAFFRLNTYTVRFLAEGAGRVASGREMQTITHGRGTYSVTAYPDEGHHFVHWAIDGEVHSDSLETQVTDVQRDMTVNAVFAEGEGVLEVGLGEEVLAEGDTLQFGTLKEPEYETLTLIAKNIGSGKLRIYRGYGYLDIHARTDCAPSRSALYAPAYGPGLMFEIPEIITLEPTEEAEIPVTYTAGYGGTTTGHAYIEYDDTEYYLGISVDDTTPVIHHPSPGPSPFRSCGCSMVGTPPMSWLPMFLVIAGMLGWRLRLSLIQVQAPCRSNSEPH